MKQLESILFASLALSGCAVDKPEPEPSCATTTCDPNATCAMTDGQPTCTCNAGYTGNGEVCFANLEPASCADILAANPSATDGTYTLYWSNQASHPWAAYCANMAAQPSEYLPLVDVNGDSNFSQYTAGGDSTGTSVRTSYQRLRIDPEWLTVDIADQTFATSTGELTEDYVITVQSMPFGVAMSCDGTTSGLANIDLSGTPFNLTQEFASQGTAASGGAAKQDAEGQVWDLTGGGGCGWVAPLGNIQEPVNNHAGYSLQLYFVE